MILVLTREDVRRLPCTKPHCNAKPGELCRRPNGRRTQAVHADRWPAVEVQSGRAA